MYEPKVQFGRIEEKGCVVQFCHETVSRGHYFKSFCRQITGQWIEINDRNG